MKRPSYWRKRKQKIRIITGYMHHHRMIHIFYWSFSKKERAHCMLPYIALFVRFCFVLLSDFFSFWYHNYNTHTNHIDIYFIIIWHPNDSNKHSNHNHNHHNQQQQCCINQSSSLLVEWWWWWLLGRPLSSLFLKIVFRFSK